MRSIDLRLGERPGEAGHDAADRTLGRLNAVEHDPDHVARVGTGERRVLGERAERERHLPAALMAGRADAGVNRRSLRMPEVRARARLGPVQKRLGALPPIGRGRPQRGRKISCDRPHFRLRHGRQIGRDRGHWADRAAVALVPGAQVGEQARLAPGDRGWRGVVERRRPPALGLAAAVRPTRVLRAQAVARRVAGSAMRERLGQVRAAVPGLALRWIRVERALVQEQKIPAGEKRPQVIGKAQVVRGRLGAHRRARHHVGVERAQIGVGEAGEVGVGEGRVEVASGTVDTLPHRADEGGFRPEPDAGVPVRGDVRSVNRAEGRAQGPPAGIGLARGGGVTGGAVAEPCQLRAAGDLGGVERSRRGERHDSRMPCQSEGRRDQQDHGQSSRRQEASGPYTHVRFMPPALHSGAAGANRPLSFPNRCWPTRPRRAGRRASPLAPLR